MIVNLKDKKHILLNDYLPYEYAENDAYTTLKFLSEPDNIGNIVFLEAINHFLDGLINIATLDFIRWHNNFSNDSTIILAFANFLSDTWVAPTGLLQALEKFKIILFSVGIQCNIGEDSQLKLSPDAQYLLEIVKKKGTVVGARGHLTSKLLERNGIESITIGCPSVYLAGHQNLKIAQKKDLIACASNTMRGVHKEIATKVNKFAVSNCKGYTFQTESALIADTLFLPDEVLSFIASTSKNPNHAALLRNKVFDYGFYNDEPSEWGIYRAWFRQYGRFFLRTKPWREFISTFDCSIGTRFHSSILALQSGVPFLIVPVDTRVSEMINFHKLPQISIEEFQKVSSLEDVLSYLSTEHYADTYKDQLNCFELFLKESFY